MRSTPGRNAAQPRSRQHGGAGRCRRAGWCRGERGAAAVELALVLPILLMIVFGIIDFGRMLNSQMTVNQAAREGARAAAVGGTQAAVDTRVQAAASGLTGVTSPITTTCAGANSAVTVTVSYTFSYVTPFSAISGMFGDGPGGSMVLTGKGVMAC